MKAVTTLAGRREFAQCRDYFGGAVLAFCDPTEKFVEFYQEDAVLVGLLFDAQGFSLGEPTVLHLRLADLDCVAPIVACRTGVPVFVLSRGEFGWRPDSVFE